MYGSVCSGIEAATAAWSELGWQPSWFSEIEPFPSALLAHHYPSVPNLHDMRILPALIRAGHIAAPDMLCGGTPCQAFSIAGLRQSLDDARGNLSLTFCEIADAIDSVRSEPAIIFWENVPGVLNTKDNAFGCFLAGLAGEDEALVPAGRRWSNAGVVYGPRRTVAWRVLDAQYFGLAQRRKRVFVVASARNDFDPAAVLFEFDGVRRDSAPRREAGEDVAPCIAGSANGGGFPGSDGACSGHVVPAGFDVQNVALTADLCGTLMGEAQKKAGQAGHGVLVNRTIPELARCVATREGRSLDFESTTILPVTHALRGEGEDGTGRGTPLIPTVYDTTQITSATNRSSPRPGDPSHPLAAAAHPPLLAFHCDAQVDQMRPDPHTSAPLTRSQHSAVSYRLAVRRLTPRECERLQGFLDDYTLTPYRRGMAADGPRYKALGNSWAVPVVRWIGRRIASHLS